MRTAFPWVPAMEWRQGPKGWAVTVRDPSPRPPYAVAVHSLWFPTPAEAWANLCEVLYGWTNMCRERE